MGDPQAFGVSLSASPPFPRSICYHNCWRSYTVALRVPFWYCGRYEGFNARSLHDSSCAGSSEAATHLVREWMYDSVYPRIWSLIILDTMNVMHSMDKQYWRTSREALFGGKSLEEVKQLSTLMFVIMLSVSHGHDTSSCTYQSACVAKRQPKSLVKAACMTSKIAASHGGNAQTRKCMINGTVVSNACKAACLLTVSFLSQVESGGSIQEVRSLLNPVRQVLSVHPFLGGPAPAAADFIIMGPFMVCIWGSACRVACSWLIWKRGRGIT